MGYPLMDGFRSKRIFVVGDIMLDRYIGGEVERISPEAPVPVLRASEEVYTPGGAANVAANLGALGSSVCLFGMVGDDKEGEIVRELLDNRHISTDGVVVSTGKSTSVKTRLISGTQQIARVDRESDEPIAGEDRERLKRLMRAAMEKAPSDGLIISDYAKGVATPDLCGALIAIAKECGGVFVAVDPKGRDFTKYRGCDVITPNQREVEELCGFKIADDSDLERAFKRLFEQRIARVVLITRGRLGISYAEDGKPHHTIPSKAKEVFDVTGAGDTALSALVLSWLSSNSWTEAARTANAAAGIVVSKLGTATVSPGELEAALKAEDGEGAAKIVSRERLSEILSNKKNQSETIVFTNGCFDLLHVGHLRLLGEAKGCGDVLIAGINSDESVRRIKGEGRPLISENDRTRLIAALECVDYVTVFDEDTPLELIKEIRPTVLVKGADYTPEQVVGKGFVEEYGGRVEIVPIKEGISTTAIIDKIRKNKAP